jgi:hypothetical protein
VRWLPTGLRLLPLFARTVALGADAQLRDDDATLVGKRIYIAARFARRAQLTVVARELEAAGAELTSRWLTTTPGPLESDQLDPDSLGGQMALMDLADVRSADVCIAFTESPGEAQGRGGRHTELGIAIALGRRIILVGPREHVFHCLPEIEQFDSWDAARGALGLEVGADPFLLDAGGPPPSHSRGSRPYAGTAS